MPQKNPPKTHNMLDVAKIKPRPREKHTEEKKELIRKLVENMIGDPFGSYDEYIKEVLTTHFERQSVSYIKTFL